MDNLQYDYVREVVKGRLGNIRKILTTATDKYDIDDSMDRHTLVDMVSDVILEIQDIKEFMDSFK